MARQPKKPSALKKLEKENPGRVETVLGTRHWKIRTGGTLVGIYPLAPRTEGFAENTKSQLRSAGLTVEGR